MKRPALLLGLTAALSLAACAGSPALPAAPADDASLSAIDINDPSRPMFGGDTGAP
ncbi:MAG TPA: hypothetical protein VM759_04835 [Longimicrobium sp.]|nr:hypothetical protein [Longimicrobium sp.]